MGAEKKCKSQSHRDLPQAYLHWQWRRIPPVQPHAWLQKIYEGFEPPKQRTARMSAQITTVCDYAFRAALHR